MVIKNIGVLVALMLMSSSSVFGATIVGSPHDLSVVNVANNDASASDNGETCVYCHTPHAANTAFIGAPLWNKNDATVKVYTMYGATVGGTAAAAAPSNPSLACLSCHDGVSAIDSIVNAAGSGMNSVTGTNDIVTALTTRYGGNIGGTPNVVTADTSVNLANDHPISITYDPTKASLRPTATLLNTTGALDAWVGATDIASLLRSGQIECSSCHDPHNGGKTQGVDTEVNFLRHSNVNSNLCVGCHDK